jgi:hypothetical protein
MKLVPPKPTSSEKKFDRSREEAFSNEGAPPPRLESPPAANADAFGVKEVNAVAAAVPSAPTGTPQSTGEPLSKPGDGTPLRGGLASGPTGGPRRS